MTRPADDPGVEGSVYFRLPNHDRGRWDPEAARLVEFDPEGAIPREVGLDDTGKPVAITRPGEFGVCNDQFYIEELRPCSPQFESFWRERGMAITRAEFEAAYSAAEARWPDPDNRRDRMYRSLWGVLFLMVVGVAIVAIASVLGLLPRG